MSSPANSLPLGGVLVGGQSRRFGSDKATVHVGGRSMAAWAVRTLREIADPVVLLGGDGSLAERMAIPWRPDTRPGCGPLAGVAAGLRWAMEADRRGLLLLACDLPLVTPSLMRAVFGAAEPDVDAVVARDDSGKIQPLCAWYGPTAWPTLEDCLDSGMYSMHGLLAQLRVRTLAEEGIPESAGPLLLNVNTPHELTVAQHWRDGAP